MRREESYLLQLVDYIKKNLGKGYTPESLKWALINQGHSKVEVGKAIALANQELAKQAPVLKEKPLIKVETIPPIEEEKSGFFKKVKSWFG
jgi:hypothetical protein